MHAWYYRARAPMDQHQPLGHAPSRTFKQPSICPSSIKLLSRMPCTSNK